MEKLIEGGKSIATTIHTQQNHATLSNKVAVLPDSTADIPQGCLNQYNITVTPIP